MDTIKSNLKKQMELMKEENKRNYSEMVDKVNLLSYEEYTKKDGNQVIWTDAINKALSEHNIIEIPSSDTPYYIDNSIIMHTNNRIVAGQNAVIKKVIGMKTVILRNENVIDESFIPCDKNTKKDYNLSIEGGIWDGSAKKRGNCGESGIYDDNDSLHGVQTSMLFSNVERLTLNNLKFIASPVFSIQTGNSKNLCFENIEFEGCFADGLHINGNTENVYAKHIHGQVGDDIVALNMFDWDVSSINFGPTRNVWCEDVELSEDSEYKAIRILPGIYHFEDGSSISCDAENIVLKNIRGINNFKLYMQTDVYPVTNPTIAEPGGGDNIFFEDISIILDKPIDELEPYLNSNPVTGTIAGFEFGANIRNVSLENIRLKIYPEKYPYSYLAAAGPKSCLFENRLEIFDPYITTEIENLYLKDIYVNDELNESPEKLVREITFDRLYDSDYSTGAGTIKNIIIKGGN